MVQTYNEFRVVLDNKGKVMEQKQTKRGSVRINKITADNNNQYVRSTSLLYELAKDQPEVSKKPGRKPNVK